VTQVSHLWITLVKRSQQNLSFLDSSLHEGIANPGFKDIADPTKEPPDPETGGFFLTRSCVYFASNSLWIATS
jgi:hypothetical protein